jgi:hypothetical protein
MGEQMTGVEIIPCADNALWRASRAQDVTASTLGALFHCHEFVSAYSLYCAKAGLVASVNEDTPTMKRGRIMEHAAVAFLRMDRPDWTIRHNDGDGRLYYRDPVARIGATPDVIATLPDGSRKVIQIKSVAAATYRKKWIIDGQHLPPQWIVLQALCERELTEADSCAVMPIVIDDFGGCETPLIEIPLDKSAAIMALAQTKVREFWQRVEDNNPPNPDYARDGDIIRDLYEGGGPQIDLSDNTRVTELCAEREVLKAKEKLGTDAGKARKVIDAELIALLGNASTARLKDGALLVAKIVKRGAYQVASTEFTQISVNEAR